MARRRRGAAGCVVGSSIIVACGFSSRVGSERPIDAAVPDAGPCMTAPTSECAGDTLRACMTVGSAPIESACAWGCVAGGSAHCGTIAPAGDVVTEADMGPAMFANVGDVVITTAATLDGSAGTITGVTSGFTHENRNTKALFRFRSLTIEGRVTLRGSGAIALIADGPIVIKNVLDAKAACGSNDAAAVPGPGGFAGATGAGSNAVGPGAGVGGTNTAGAGGGGNGGSGGGGGAGGAGAAGGGGSAVAMTFAVLAGGGGGGASEGGGGHARGGGGGGAVQLVSNTQIVLTSGGIDVGGCGGDSGGGGGADGGGGGGAGGTIVLEAPVIEGGGGMLAANGGGGGAGDDPSNATGDAGTFTRLPAAGAASVANAGGGGSGGAGMFPTGGLGQSDATRGGGGGGGIGRIRLNTRSGDFTAAGSAWSPARTETGFSNGPATVH